MLSFWITKLTSNVQFEFEKFGPCIREIKIFSPYNIIYVHILFNVSCKLSLFKMNHECAYGKEVPH